jgi:hypothetical protein
MTWNFGSKSGFDWGSIGVALLGALASNLGVDLGIWFWILGFGTESSFWLGAPALNALFWALKATISLFGGAKFATTLFVF